MKSILSSLLLALTFAVVPIALIAAPAKEDPKKDKEKPAKEKPGTPTIEWTEVKSDTGELKRQQPRPDGSKPEPEAIEFEVDAKAQGFRISWTTEPGGDSKRGGQMKASLFRKTEANGKVTFRAAGILGVIRASQDGSKIFAGGGNYRLELVGEEIKYKIVIESAEKKAAGAPDSADKKK